MNVGRTSVSLCRSTTKAQPQQQTSKDKSFNSDFLYSTQSNCFCQTLSSSLKEENRIYVYCFVFFRSDIDGVGRVVPKLIMKGKCRQKFNKLLLLYKEYFLRYFPFRRKYLILNKMEGDLVEIVLHLVPFYHRLFILHCAFLNSTLIVVCN